MIRFKASRDWISMARRHQHLRHLRDYIHGSQASGMVARAHTNSQQPVFEAEITFLPEFIMKSEPSFQTCLVYDQKGRRQGAGSFSIIFSGSAWLATLARISSVARSWLLCTCQGRLLAVKSSSSRRFRPSLVGSRRSAREPLVAMRERERCK